MKESLDFYNQFDLKLIGDYINRNKRIESAILKLSKFIPENSKRILDIGCGIGWSSHEIALQFPKAQVDGVDLSPVLIDVASKLFSLDNLNYFIKDITKDLPSLKYDAIVMIDVYEHIPAEDRKSFHDGITSLLSENGRLILACPTKYHQTWLRENKPSGLQPIDEDVDPNTILSIAEDLGGELVYFSYQKIWHSFDYLYAVIEISPIYDSGLDIKSKKEISLEPVSSRLRRIKDKLRIDSSNILNSRNNRNPIFKISELIKRTVSKFK